MKKEDIQPSMRVKVPETRWTPAQTGIVDQRSPFGKTGKILVGLHGGALYFDADQLQKEG